MLKPTRIRLSIACSVLLVVAAGAAQSQSPPNPYRLVDGWAKLPGGREMGAVGDVIVDPDGEHIWAVIRCDAGPERFGWECLDSDLDSIIEFDAGGNVVESFGGGLFIWPHGIDVDNDGNVWVTDAAAPERTDGKRGHQVVKFSPSGAVLMVLGTPGEPGSDNAHFNAPADVAVAANGDIFVADGHAEDGNNRVVKFSSGRSRPHPRRGLGIRRRSKSRLGDGYSHRRRRDRLGPRVHSLSVGRPARRRRQWRRVRCHRRGRQPLRRRTAAA